MRRYNHTTSSPLSSPSSALPPPFTNSNELLALQRKYPALTQSQIINFAKWFHSLTSHSKHSSSTSASSSSYPSPSSPSSSFSSPVPASPLGGVKSRSSSPSSSQPTPPSTPLCSLSSLKDHFLEFEYFANLLLSTSLIRNKHELLLICSSASNSLTLSSSFSSSTSSSSFLDHGLLSFDDFFSILSLKQFSLKRFEKLIGLESSLSADVLITIERRKLLMEHIVDRSILRGIGLDYIASSTPTPTLGNISASSSFGTSSSSLLMPSSARSRPYSPSPLTLNTTSSSLNSTTLPTSPQGVRRQKQRQQHRQTNSLDAMSQLHDRQKQQAAEVIWELADGLKRERDFLQTLETQRREKQYRKRPETSRTPYPATARGVISVPVLVPLEELITSTKLLSVITGEEFKSLFVIPPLALGTASTAAMETPQGTFRGGRRQEHRRRSGGGGEEKMMKMINSPQEICLKDFSPSLNDSSNDWITAVSKSTPRVPTTARESLSPRIDVVSAPALMESVTSLDELSSSSLSSQSCSTRSAVESKSVVLLSQKRSSKRVLTAKPSSPAASLSLSVATRLATPPSPIVPVTRSKPSLQTSKSQPSLASSSLIQSSKNESMASPSFTTPSSLPAAAIPLLTTFDLEADESMISPGSEHGSDVVMLSVSASPLQGIHPMRQHTPVSERISPTSTIGVRSRSSSGPKNFTFFSSSTVVCKAPTPAQSPSPLMIKQLNHELLKRPTTTGTVSARTRKPPTQDSTFSRSRHW
jgi:hypothetical protein